MLFNLGLDSQVNNYLLKIFDLKKLSENRISWRNDYSKIYKLIFLFMFLKLSYSTWDPFSEFLTNHIFDLSIASTTGMCDFTFFNCSAKLSGISFINIKNKNLGIYFILMIHYFDEIETVLPFI